MKIAKIITIATGANAFSLPEWFQNNGEDPTSTGDYNMELTTTTGDYGTGGWASTVSTTTEELTTTSEPESTLSTTTDGEYTPPDYTTTSMPSTELTSTTNVPSSDLGPTIIIDVIDDCAENDKTEVPTDKNVGGWWSAAYEYVACFIYDC